MKRQNVRTLALIVCTFTYLLIGAAIFGYLEASTEEKNRRDHDLKTSQWRDRLDNVSDKEWERLYNTTLSLKAYKGAIQWKFARAFYFATTVITTIGYGHSTPKTDWGKVFCMAYAMAGIPLCIVMFQSVGERMNAFITWALIGGKRIFRRMTHRGRTGRRQMAEPVVTEAQLIVISANVGIIVVSGGAYAFTVIEGWNYVDALYYCLITLTTIGFGDFVAMQNDENSSHDPQYVIFNLIFILFGLTVVGSVMNLLVLRFLTMNTEDERRDEIEAAIQAHDRNRLQGDVIVSNGRLGCQIQRPFSARSSRTSRDMFMDEYEFLELPDHRFPHSVYAASGASSSLRFFPEVLSVDEEGFHESRCCGCCLKTRASSRNIRSSWRGGSSSGCFRPRGKHKSFIMKRQKRYTVVRSPCRVEHLAESAMAQTCFDAAPQLSRPSCSSLFTGPSAERRSPALSSNSQGVFSSACPSPTEHFVFQVPTSRTSFPHNPVQLTYYNRCILRRASM